jgi:hypothetical protein
LELHTELNRYLQNIRENLRLDPASEKEIIREIEAHVEDSCLEMQQSGMSEAAAVERSLRMLGPARTVARQIYETHCRGTWRQALLSAMPHLFFAALFTLNWFTGVVWITVMVIAVSAIVVIALSHGKPGWLFPWLGYSLLPVVMAGLAMLYLPRGWAWVALLLYIPLVIWLVCLITIKFIRRDWIYSSLMLLPVPTIVGWFVASNRETLLTSSVNNFLPDFTPWTAVTFLLLAFAVTVFVRSKSRRLRVIALCIAGFGTTAIITLVSNRLGFPAFIGLAILTASFILIPAYIELRLRKHRRRPLTSS